MRIAGQREGMNFIERLLGTAQCGSIECMRANVNFLNSHKKLSSRGMPCLHTNRYLLFTNKKAETDGLEINWDYITRHNN